jgi:hypothetical protein
MAIDFSKYFVLEDYKALNPDLQFSTDSGYLDHWQRCGINELRLFNRKLVDIDCEFSHEANFFSPYFTYLYNNNLFHPTITVHSHVGMEPFYRHLRDKISIEFTKTTRATCLISWFILDHHLELYQERKHLVLPDFKKYYTHDLFKFPKPILLLSNKYDLNLLQHQLLYRAATVLDLFEKLNDRYQIIYLQSPPLVQPNGYAIEHLEEPILDEKCADFEHFGPRGLQRLKEQYPDIVFFDDLLSEHNVPYNELLLKVLSSCVNYISHPSGLSELIARYFAEKIVCWDVPYLRGAVESGLYITDSRFVTHDEMNNLAVMERHCKDLFM